MTGVLLNLKTAMVSWTKTVVQTADKNLSTKIILISRGDGLHGLFMRPCLEFKED
jgi:hypothetical protein